MLIKQVEVEEIVKRIRKMALTKQLNFLIVSGASAPAIPLMSWIDADTDEERNLKIDPFRNKKNFRSLLKIF